MQAIIEIERLVLARGWRMRRGTYPGCKALNSKKLMRALKYFCL